MRLPGACASGCGRSRLSLLDPPEDSIAPHTQPAAAWAPGAALVAFADGLGEAMVVLDRDLRVVLCNEAAERYNGRYVSRRSLIGRNIIEAMPEVAGSPAEACWRETVATGQPSEIVAPASQRPDRLVRVRTVPLPDGAVASFGRDVTRDHLIEAIEQEVRALWDPAAAIDATMRLLREQLGAARVVYSVVDMERGETLHRMQSLAPGVEALPARASHASFSLEALAQLSAGSPLTSEDTTRDLMFQAPRVRDLLKSHSTRAFATIPLVKQGRLRAMFSVHMAQPFEWASDRLSLVTEIAERTWSAFERVLGGEELSDSNARLALALEAAKLGDWSWDVETDRVDFSTRAAEIFGLPPGPILTWEQVVELIHPEDRPVAHAAADGAMAGADSYEVEYRIVRPGDGALVWISARGRAVRNAQGKPIARLGVVADVTGAKAVEAELKADKARLEAIERRQSFLLRLSDRLRQESEAGAVMRCAAAMLGEHLGVQRVGYGDAVEKGKSFRVDNTWTEGAAPITGVFQLADFADARDRLAAGQAFIVRDVGREVRDRAHRASFAAIGVQAVITVPLHRNDATDALLFAHSSSPRDWTQADIDIVAEVAQRTWEAVERAKAENEQQRSRERLHLALNAARMVAWEHDLKTGETRRSENALELWGPPNPEGRYDERYHPEDALALRDLGLRALETGQRGSCDLRFRIGDDWRVLHAVMVPEPEGGAPVERLIGVALDLTEQRRAEQILREARDSLVARVQDETAQRQRAEQIREQFWNLSRDLFAIISLDGVPLLMNDAWEGALGYPIAEMVGRDIKPLIHPDDYRATLNLNQPLRDAAQPVHGFENRYRHANGSWRWLSWSVIVESDMFFAVARDVTEDKAREEHAARTQKLEALGQLTGGVAHDFNNLLTAIIGALDMIRRRPADQVLRERMIGAAFAAAKRGERLNKQLLGFARRQALKPSFVQIDRFLAEMRPLLKGALGDAVRLELRLDAGDQGSRVDASQFEAAILNLVVNARDAMPEGGALTIATGAADAKTVARLGLPEGAYLRLSVADTGVGMSPDVIARAFEPFFTTKEIGKGSGLGLSHVYGFARQSGGVAEVESRPDHGASIRLYLPIDAEGAGLQEPQTDQPRAGARPREILLVDDDALVGVVAENILTDLGHVVTRAEDGPQALDLLDRQSFDVLVTDVRMPGGLNGVQLAAEAVRRQPGLKVLLSSGWTEDALGGELRGSRWPLLPKPFDSEQMQAALQSVLSSL